MKNICVFDRCTAVHRHLQLPRSEQDYIEMYNLFLASGTHHLEVENISAGRNLIDVFLQTLKNFHEVGCLTLSCEQLPDYVTDIFQDILMNGDIHDVEILQNFFLNSFSCDFLWIEATAELQKALWFAAFSTTIKQFSIDQHIPIVIVTYE